MNDPEVEPGLAIRPGAYYSNGAYGRAWGVRLVVGIDIDATGTTAMLTFKGIAGACRRKAGHCPLNAFVEWARYEVALNENSWQRIGRGLAEL
jgi:hypothetical protein